MSDSAERGENSEVVGEEEVEREEEGDDDDDDDDDDEGRECFDEFLHRTSISNTIIEFEYFVKNPFKTNRGVKFCLESQTLVLYDGRHLPLECLLSISQPPSLAAQTACLISIRLGSKLKEKKWYFKDADELSRFQVVVNALKKSGGVILDAFQQIKGNNKNQLSWIELKKSAAKLDINLTEDQTRKMINLADPDNKSFLKYLDFFNFFSTSAACILDYESCILEWKQRLEGNLRGSSRRSSIIVTPKDGPLPIHKYQSSLMKGEIVLNIIQQTRYFFSLVQSQEDRTPFIGDIYITNYRLNFISHDTFTSLVNTRREIPLCFADISIPLATISRIDLLKCDAYSVSIICKDLRICKIRFEAKEGFAKSFEDVISSQAFVQDPRAGFAFSNKEPWDERGKSVYCITREFERQGVLQSNLWRIWNDNYAISPTYPAEFILPSVMSNTDIIEASKFRSKGRLPVLTWRNPRNGAVLARSAQPMVGVLGHKSLADKYLLNLFRTKGDSADNKEIDDPSELYIVDCRRSIAASANTAMGKGVEDVKSYSHTRLTFADIENIHVMRASLKSLEDALAFCCPGHPDEAKFHAKVEESGWLYHLNMILKASVLAAEKLEIEEAGVLIHCSDGWDRTAQLCATVQLLLDSYYRTIEGFCVLIEKDWCSFGHKFQDRLGHYSSADSQERSPVFLQWLDVVRVILQQFPSCFQFTEQLLVFIMDSALSCQFGNFLGNCEKDRDNLQCKEATQSVWSYVFFHSSAFTNDCFVEHNGPLWPSTCLAKCTLWERYFCRWIHGMHPRHCSGLSWENDWGTNLKRPTEAKDLCPDFDSGNKHTEDSLESSSNTSDTCTSGSFIKTSRVLSL